MVLTELPSSFEGRWSGLQTVEAGLAFNARWALESQDYNDRVAAASAYASVTSDEAAAPMSKLSWRPLCLATTAVGLAMTRGRGEAEHWCSWSTMMRRCGRRSQACCNQLTCASRRSVQLLIF